MINSYIAAIKRRFDCIAAIKLFASDGREMSSGAFANKRTTASLYSAIKVSGVVVIIERFAVTGLPVAFDSATICAM